jgi:YVTN family beta-propeller protein
MCAVGVSVVRRHESEGAVPLPTGRFLHAGTVSAEVGSFPGNMRISPDGRFIAVSDFGSRQQLSILDSSTGSLLGKLDFNSESKSGKDSLYYGLAFAPDGTLYVSRGGQEKVSVVSIAANGTPSLESKEFSVPSGIADEPNFVAGVAVSQDGAKIFAVGNESYFHMSGGKLTGGNGNLSIINAASGAVDRKIDLQGFPFDVVCGTRGGAQGKLYCSNERDGTVSVLTERGEPRSTISTGTAPTCLVLSNNQDRLFVSNASSDTISVVDTRTDGVLSTILVRPPAMHGLPGFTPLGMTLSQDGNTLFAALADMNAVAVVDVSSSKVLGYLPTGWYPTSVAASAKGDRLYIANAKGLTPRVPNGEAVQGRGHYIEDLLEGAITCYDLPLKPAVLQHLTEVAMRANGFSGGTRTPFARPPVQHVVYIIKENRSYDQVYGDVPGGNGDPKLCLYGRDVTPNQHALAERFVLLDNFYVCSEVSADGWNWSTAGMASPYVQRNTRVTYSNRGRSYDFEGKNNDLSAELSGMRDVAAPAGGYLWDAAETAKIAYRNYGAFLSGEDGVEFPHAEQPSKKALVGKTDLNYRPFDMGYPDSDAWVKLKHYAPKQRLSFGAHAAPSRFSEWKQEFDRFVSTKSLPALMILRLPCDHTAGTRPGLSSPKAMVADNDYAVGEIVQAVSHSPYWKDTVICILEDDAQSGRDHVDCHRSGALLISPYVERSKVDHRFWNTDCMLKTIEELLHLKPMCQYDAWASPIDVFSHTAQNNVPYEALLPPSDILNQVNTRSSYRARDSQQLISLYKEENEADTVLEDILYGSR